MRRPHHETLKAYARKLSALALELVENGGTLEGAGAKAQGEVRHEVSRGRPPPQQNVQAAG